MRTSTTTQDEMYSKTTIRQEILSLNLSRAVRRGTMVINQTHLAHQHQSLSKRTATSRPANRIPASLSTSRILYHGLRGVGVAAAESAR